MKALTSRVALVATALSMMVAAQAQDTYKMRLALEAGKALHVTTVSSTKMAFTGPIEQEMNTKTTMVQAYKFDQGTDGWWKVALTTVDFKMDGDAGMPGMSADPAAILDAVKKVKISAEINNLGQARNVKLEGDQDLDMMTKGMTASVSEYLAQIGFMGVQFPEEAVGVGTKWKKEFDMAKILEANGGGFLSNAKGMMPIEFEVLGFEDVNGVKAAKIQIFTDGKVTFDSQMGGSGTMSTTSKGTTWINVATGLPIKSETKMANNIDIGGQMNISQEMSINSTTEIKG